VHTHIWPIITQQDTAALQTDQLCL